MIACLDTCLEERRCIFLLTPEPRRDLVIQVARAGHEDIAEVVADVTGIPYVIVNGTVVVKDSKVLKDVFPGQPIRGDAR